MSMPSPTLSEDMKAKYKEAFARMDRDGSGTLNVNDIETLLSQLGVEVTRAEVEDLIREVDEDGDGELSLEELLDAVTYHKNSVLAGVIDQLILSDSQIAELRDVFRLFDTDGDGAITAAELARVLTDLGQEVDEDELSEMIAEVDTNADGTIEFDEFCSMMSRRMKDSDLESDLRAVFTLFDPDGTGAATVESVMSVFASVGESLSRSDAVRLLRVADLDQDGVFSAEDLLDVMHVRTRKAASGNDLNTSSAFNLSSLLAGQSIASLTGSEA